MATSRATLAVAVTAVAAAVPAGARELKFLQKRDLCRMVSLRTSPQDQKRLRGGKRVSSKLT